MCLCWEWSLRGRRMGVLGNQMNTQNVRKFYFIQSGYPQTPWSGYLQSWYPQFGYPQPGFPQSGTHILVTPPGLTHELALTKYPCILQPAMYDCPRGFMTNNKQTTSRLGARRLKPFRAQKEIFVWMDTHVTFLVRTDKFYPKVILKIGFFTKYLIYIP